MSKMLPTVVLRGRTAIGSALRPGLTRQYSATTHPPRSLLESLARLKLEEAEKHSRAEFMESKNKELARHICQWEETHPEDSRKFLTQVATVRSDPRCVAVRINPPFSDTHNMTFIGAILRHIFNAKMNNFLGLARISGTDTQPLHTDFIGHDADLMIMSGEKVTELALTDFKLAEDIFSRISKKSQKVLQQNIFTVRNVKIAKIPIFYVDDRDHLCINLPAPHSNIGISEKGLFLKGVPLEDAEKALDELKQAVQEARIDSTITIKERDSWLVDGTNSIHGRRHKDETREGEAKDSETRKASNTAKTSDKESRQLERTYFMVPSTEPKIRGSKRLEPSIFGIMDL